MQASLVDMMVKDPPTTAEGIRDMGWIPESVRSPGEENGNPLQSSCLENSMDTGAGGLYSPQGHKESDMTEQLSLCRYADDTTIMAESKKELKNLFMRMKEESEKAV